MQNFAGQWRCDDVIPGELVYAGITPVYHIEQEAGEVPTHFTGELHGWIFRRAWYYWVAKGPGLPLEYASPLHRLFGTEVRVEGHCGCPSPEEWNGLDGARKSDGSVALYHVDTQEGLAVLAATIKKWHRDTRKPPNHLLERKTGKEPL